MTCWHVGGMNLEEIINAAVEKKINEMVSDAIRDIHYSHSENAGARKTINDLVQEVAKREIEKRKDEIEQRVISEMQNMHINWTANIEVQSEPQGNPSTKFQLTSQHVDHKTA